MKDKYFEDKIQEFLDKKDKSVKVTFFDLYLDLLRLSPDMMHLILRFGGAFIDLNQPAIFLLKYKKISIPDGKFSGMIPSENLLYLLSHEYGHYLSFKAGNWTDELIKGIKNNDFGLQYPEEERAWNFGENFLRGLNVDIGKNFYKQRAKSLGTYKVK